MPDRLLAKSWSGNGPLPRGVLLQGHTAEVLAAARHLLAARGSASLLAVGLSVTLLPRLERIVLLACLIHDFGKCSDHFQQMIHGARNQRQLIRHEAVSALLVWISDLRGWLASGLMDPADLILVLAAAAGHHRKFPGGALQDEVGVGMRLLCHSAHADLRHTLALGSSLGLAPAPAMVDQTLSLALGGIKPLLDEVFPRALEERCCQDPVAAHLLAVTKALVLAADVAGSALPAVGARSSWVADQLAHVHGDLVAATVAKRLGSHELRPFQAAVAACHAPVALVRAGCGSGKTLAAYAWARDQHPTRQLWVCYPTTGTATEGFRDYLDGIDGTRLDHSRVAVDVQMLGLRDGDDAEARDQDRLAALRVWGDHIVSCTVDTVFGLLMNQRKGLYAWPGLADSAVVLDEIHAYDDRMFGLLLRFLRGLPGIPVLLMTASLPSGRLQALRSCVRTVHAQDLVVLDGPPDLETRPRYHRSEGEVSAVIHAAWQRGERILQVCNTVDRCLAAGDEARARGMSPLLYHSRFRYEDRVERHRDVITAFRTAGPCLAICTQVAEMSLDLSADLLVSDLAPVPALIQRLGRLNRRAAEGDPTRPFVIVAPASHHPYEQPALDDATAWLERLGSGPLCQQDLVTAWADSLDAPPEQACAWLDGGMTTMPGEVREGSPGITVLLAQDRASVRRDGSFALRAALPVPEPRGLRWRDWPRESYLPVVPDGLIDYDPIRGAAWRK